MRLEGESGRRQKSGALGQRAAPFPRREPGHEEREVLQPIRAQATVRRDPVLPDRALSVEACAAEARNAQAVEGDVRSSFGDFQRERAAVDLGVVDAGDVYVSAARKATSRGRRSMLCRHRRSGAHPHRAGRSRGPLRGGPIPPFGACESERTSKVGSIERDLQVASRKPDAHASICPKAMRGDQPARRRARRDRPQIRRPRGARPLAKKREVLATEVDHPVELRPRARLEIALSAEPACGPGGRDRKRTGSGALAVDCHARKTHRTPCPAPRMMVSATSFASTAHEAGAALKLGRDAPDSKARARAGATPSSPLWRKQRIEIGLFGFALDLFSSRAGDPHTSALPAPSARERPLLRSKTKLGLLDRRMVEDRPLIRPAACR